MQMEPGVLHWQFTHLGQYWGAVVLRNSEILLVKSKYILASIHRMVVFLETQGLLKLHEEDLADPVQCHWHRKRSVEL